MCAQSRKWVMAGPDQSLVEVSAVASLLDPDQLVVEIDACSLWSADLDFEFGGAHGAHAMPAGLQHRVNGHVIEAGVDALFYTDRTVALETVVPCGDNGACWLGGAAACPHKEEGAAGGNCVVAHARDVRLVERRRPTLPPQGLTPFKDE